MDLSSLRRDYCRMALTESEIDPDPFRQFHEWLRQAVEAGVEDASAMSLSTVDPSGAPSSRMILLKELDDEGFVFFTSYASRKGEDLKTNPLAALLFYWRELDRQVRVTGTAARLSRSESAAYFHTRPPESRISAAISPQSQPVPDRLWLESRRDEYRRRLGGRAPKLPSFWGGYRVAPSEFEFFQGRPGRLHDRIRYTLHGSGWKIERLAP